MPRITTTIVNELIVIRGPTVRNAKLVMKKLIFTLMKKGQNKETLKNTSRKSNLRFNLQFIIMQMKDGYIFALLSIYDVCKTTVKMSMLHFQ